MNQQRFLFGAAVGGLVAAFVIGAVVYRQQRTEQLSFMAQQSFTTFVRPHSQVLGAADAKVYLVEFTDPACETCAAFSPMVKNLMAAHPNQIKLVVRYAPFHPGSDGVVRVLHAATLQGKFWEALEIMYKSQPAWASHHQPQPELLWGFLAQGGIDLERLNKDVQSPEIAKAVQQDLADAQALGVTKTPGFFVNGKPLVQFGYPQLEELVKAELALSYPK
jgi:protein-disulfide isomerase